MTRSGKGENPSNSKLPGSVCQPQQVEPFFAVYEDLENILKYTVSIRKPCWYTEELMRIYIPTKKKILSASILPVTITILISQAIAHHSHGNYEIGKEIQVQGIVTEFHFANPHVWVFMSINNEIGETEDWALEGGGTASFSRKGWDGIADGDELTVTCTPTRDGDNGCFITNININESNLVVDGTSSWINIAFPDQFFSANFPSKPTINTVPYPSEYGGTFPSTIYTARENDNHYSVTVVDFSDAKNIYLQLAKEINVAGAHNFWLYDQMGAISYAAQQFRLRGGEVTYDAWHHVDFIGGHQLFLTNPDQTRTYAGIYRHANRLYILEATVTAGTPPQGIFQQSLTILDKEGKRVRYDLQPDHTRARIEVD